jgi:hypothetical protein
MIIFDLANLNIEHITIGADFQLAYKINDNHIVPLFLKLPIIYFNSDDCIKKNNGYYDLLITCVSTDLDDILSPLIQGIEDRIFELIKPNSSLFSHLKYKTTLGTKTKNTNQLPWYQYGMMKLEFQENDINIFDENDKKIDVNKLLSNTDSVGGYIVPILHLKSLWKNDHSFGLLWKTIQLQFIDKLAPLITYSSDNNQYYQQVSFTESSDSDSFTPTDSEE